MKDEDQCGTPLNPEPRRADLMVSWNFKHIVNVAKIRGFNSVNLREGYPTIDIRSPKEVV